MSAALVTREGRVTIVSINRPAAMNALDFPAHEELGRIFDDFDADPDQWVAILTGEGEKAFCAGQDLRAHAEGADLTLPPRGFGGLTSRFDLRKPVIAAVNGLAFGGGFELALACDLIIASDHARFALPEPRVGLAALAGGVQRLPRMIGLKPAMGMMLTGRSVTAAEGERLGFVNQVTSGDVLSAAKEWAEAILACSPLAVRATKAVVMDDLEGRFADTIDAGWAHPAVLAMLASADAREGPQAFALKRPPLWRGV